MENLIDANRLKENLELFSFPRLSGTVHEMKAFKLAKEQLEKLELKPEIQTFKFSTFYSRIYPKITFPIIFWFFFTLLVPLNTLFVRTSLIIIFAVFLPFFIITRKPEKIRIGKVLESQNLYATLNTLDSSSSNPNYKNKNYNIFFMAHLDSKGQRITARVRAFSILLLVVSIALIIIILILRSFMPFELAIFITQAGYIPLGILFVVTLIFVFNGTNNKSKGVVDNASGIICVLELAHYFAIEENRPKNCNLWFVLTGAEETGTMGIRYFHKLFEGISKEKSVVNNFESLGKSVNIMLSRSTRKNHPDLDNLIREKAKKNGFRAMTNPFTMGVHTDGVYLLRKGFNTVEYGSTEVSKYMHSEKDSVDNVDTALMGKLCEYVIETVHELDKV